MAKIPALVYLFVGILVAIVSLRMGNSFAFFFYVGLIFIGIGLAKLLITFMLRKKETKVERKIEAPTLRFCLRCRSSVRPTDYFCWRCGTRLR